MENINVNSKSNTLVSVLKVHFKGELNLARIKFISLFVIALTKVRTVSFENLARAFDTKAEESSSLRRIQRFIAGYVAISVYGCHLFRSMGATLKDPAMLVKKSLVTSHYILSHRLSFEVNSV